METIKWDELFKNLSWHVVSTQSALTLLLAKNTTLEPHMAREEPQFSFTATDIHQVGPEMGMWQWHGPEPGRWQSPARCAQAR